MLLDAPDEVTRHAVGESAGANEHVDAPGRLGQEDGRLTGCVSAPDHHDLLIHAQCRYRGSRAVVDPGTIETTGVLDGQSSILGSGGDDDGPTSYLRVRVEGDSEWPVLAIQTERRLRHEDLGTELADLGMGAQRQIMT